MRILSSFLIWGFCFLSVFIFIVLVKYPCLYTRLCIKWITNENQLYSTGSSTQCSVVTSMGRKYQKEGIYANIELVAQMMTNLRAMWETQDQFLGREDPLEKGMAIHSSVLAWRIPWTEEPGRLQAMECQRVGHNRATNISAFFIFHG